MKYFIALILIIADFGYSQENKTDSTSIIHTFIQPSPLNDFNFYFSLDNFNNKIYDIPLSSNPQSIVLWTSFAVSQSCIGETLPGETKLYMLTPLSIKYRENSKFNSLSYILGMAQTAAAGYMVYKRIKKYGFK